MWQRNVSVCVIEMISKLNIFLIVIDSFYMPHGLTIDHENNLWMTDVAMHQVFKFGPCGNDSDRSRRRKQRPMMTLGTLFHPGAGESCFCKPTAVAVLPENGDFFVADGYCNSRILKYSADGKRILSWGTTTFGGGDAYEVAPPNYFAIPHDLTFIPESKLICVADRENGRVQCFHSINGTFHSQYHSPIIGDRLFSVDFTRAQGKIVYNYFKLNQVVQCNCFLTEKPCICYRWTICCSEWSYRRVWL